MSIKTIVAALQAKNATVTGMKSAPTKYPASLSTADLPCALTRPGNCTWQDTAIGDSQQVRTYLVEVYVQPVAQGIVPDDGFQKAEDLLDAAGAVYVADRTAGSSAIEDIASITDGGIQILLFANHVYVGFVLSLQVIEA